jgi:hypothetical protein
MAVEVFSEDVELAYRKRNSHSQSTLCQVEDRDGSDTIVTHYKRCSEGKIGL